MKNRSPRWVILIVILGIIFPEMSVFAISPDNPENRPYDDLKRWHLGFSVGMHFQDMKFYHNGIPGETGNIHYAEIPDFSPGFCVNVLGDLRLHKYLNLRFNPGIYFGNKVIHILNRTDMSVEKQNERSTYVVMPLDLKVSGLRLRNVRPYVTAGVMGAFDIGRKRNELLRFNKADAYLTVGFGVDFYLPFFKLIPELKFCFGLTDILNHNRPDLYDDPQALDVTRALNKVKSNMVVLSFYFE